MDKIEYLLFIPLLIYGISLSDLLSEYRKLIKNRIFYFKYLAAILMLSEVAIYNIYKLYSVINSYDVTTYVQYWALLIPPIIFMISVHVFVIEDKYLNLEVIETEFQKNIKPTFGLVSIYIAIHFIPMMSPDGHAVWGRLITITILLTYIFLRKDIVFYFLIAAWFINFISHINAIVI